MAAAGGACLGKCFLMLAWAACNMPHRLPPLPATPARRLDECHRVLQAGARVLTLDQLEGLKVGMAAQGAARLA